MKRLVGLILVATLLATLVAVVSGCGTTTETKESPGIVTPGGPITITRSGNTVTVTRGKTTMTWTADTADEKAIGVPLPSDAKLVSGTAVKVANKSSGETWLGGTFYSNDDTNTVILFYRQNLSSMEGFTDTSTMLAGNQVGLFSVKSGDNVKSFIIRAAEAGEQGKTWIQIANVTGAK